MWCVHSQMGLTCLAWACAGAIGVAPAACSGGLSSQSCGQIPGAGCPKERGGTCEDPSCDAVYSCDDGQWILVEVCEQNGAGGAGGTSTGGAPAGGAAGGGFGGEGGCSPADIDHSGEATGCVPDLVLPDCPVEAAESCHPCTTGCVDFLLCRAGGWDLVAYCTDDGEVVVL